MGPHLALAVMEGAGTPGAAMGLGLASAMSFAASNALQHRAAGRLPHTARTTYVVLGQLARQPLWVLGTLISALAVAMHALAFQFGSIAMVQPLMLLGVILAVPARSALERARPRWCEVRAVGITAIGLAVFMLAVTTRPSERSPRIVSAALFVALCFVVGLSALRASGSSKEASTQRRAMLLACGAGCMFGITAGCLKVLGGLLDGHGHRGWLVFAAGATVLLAGVLGTAMNQKAFQIAPLSFSLPVVNVVDLTVAVCFGWAVFGEAPGHSAGVLTLELPAILCIAVGLRLIADVTRTPARSASV
jgi:hypothetical protein